MERSRNVIGAAVDGDHSVPHYRISLGTFVEQLPCGKGGYAFAVHVDECGRDEGVGEKAGLGDMGVDGVARAREVEGGTGLES